MRGLAALVAASVLLAAASPGDALVLCQKKRGGKVAARDACRKKESPVDLAALGALGPQGVAGAPGGAGAPGAHPLRLLDALDVELGDILFFFPSSAFVEISRSPLPQPVVFVVLPSGFAHNIAGAVSSVYYQSADCSGVPLIRQQFGMVIGQVYGDFAYFSAEESASRSYASVENDTSGAPCGGGSVATGRGTCCSTTSGSLSVQTAVRVALSALGLTPPFRAEPR